MHSTSIVSVDPGVWHEAGILRFQHIKRGLILQMFYELMTHKQTELRRFPRKYLSDEITILYNMSVQLLGHDIWKIMI